MTEELFWKIHSGLPREAPGCDFWTLRSFHCMHDKRHNPSLLDIGCGPGAQTIALAKHSTAQITAIDTHQPFLDELNRRAAEKGLSERIKTLNMSMFDLQFDEKFDIIWSEGAIYIIGFERGLREWRKLLNPGGYIGVTEISWLKPNPPAEALEFWQNAYPGMATVEENLARIERAGYRLVMTQPLFAQYWWREYYDPMKEKIAVLREEYRDDPQAQAFLDAEYAEIALFEKYSDYYSYVYYVMQAVE
jgi:ubiquinone/menaquinone biosynthesis C-methylase UbiE